MSEILNAATTRERLFTPGPLNTSDAVRGAISRDLGSRTPEAMQLTQDICQNLEQLAQCSGSHSCVLMQGSGTFAVEAMLTSLVPENGRVLVVDNGVYGKRMVDICEIHQLPFVQASLAETEVVTGQQIEKLLAQHPDVSHLTIVHFETALGVMNDLSSVLEICARHKVKVLLDAMSSFGAYPLPFDSGALTAVAAASNKCLHGIPGLGFVLVANEDLQQSANSRTLSLDLRLQYNSLKSSGGWRFTPPLQVMLGLQQAIAEFIAQGGVKRRLQKYQQLNDLLLEGLVGHGIHPLLEADKRAPMITTFLLPEGTSFDSLYQFLLAKDLIIYPSKVSGCFRLGCIGELTEGDIQELVTAIGDWLTCEVAYE